MMTVGYGDYVTPITFNERLYVTLSMAFGVSTYAVVLNYISKMVSEHNLVVTDFREKIMYVN